MATIKKLQTTEVLIKNSLRSKSKLISPDPFKPSKKEVVKKEKIAVIKLRNICIEYLRKFTAIINQINIWVLKIPKMEKQIETLTDELKKADRRIDRLEDYRDNRSVSNRYLNKIRKEQSQQMDKMGKSISSLTNKLKLQSSAEEEEE